MKKKFIFAVLVMLAFGLSIGCANTSTSVQVPIEYMISNQLDDGIDVTVRFCEVGSMPDGNREWNPEIIQVLTSPQYIGNGQTKTFTIDVGSCMEYDAIYVEATQTKNGEFVGYGFVDWFGIHWILTEGNGRKEQVLTGHW